MSYYPATFISKYADELLVEMGTYTHDDRLELIKALGIAFIKSKPSRSNLKL
jgi:hypothetical protein